MADRPILRRLRSPLVCRLLLLAGVAATVKISPAFIVAAPIAGSNGRARSSMLAGPGSYQEPRSAAASPEEEIQFSLSWAAASTACACAFVASVALRRLEQQRTVCVQMGYKPIHRGVNRLKVLKRLEPFGPCPAIHMEPLPPRKKKGASAPRASAKPKKRLSAWGRWFLEKQRVQFHYNIKYKQLRAYMMRGWMRGVDYPLDHVVQELESRLDNVLWRVGLASTMVGAQKLIFQGHIQYKLSGMKGWRTINHASAHCQVGMKFRVCNRKNIRTMCQTVMDSIGPVELPSHLTWDPLAMTGKYLDVCQITELGLWIDEEYFLRFFTENQNQLRRLHYRYYEGTNIILKKMKIKDEYRIRATPENIINMRRGLGLYAKGRRRPPCLWGRSKPQNSLYKYRRPHIIPYF